MQPDIDDDEDLSNADFGDELEPQDDNGDVDPIAVAKDAKDVKAALKKEDKSDADAAAEAAAEAEAAATDAEAAAAEAEAAAAEAEAAASEDKENLPIRLNKMRGQRDAERAAREAAEAKLVAVLEKQAVPKQEPAPDPRIAIEKELDSMYEQVEQARADGDTKVAATLQRQIDKYNQELIRVESTQIARQASTASQLNARYDAMLDVMEANVPFLNTSSDQFDKGAVAEMEFQVAAYEKMGLSAPDALRRASKLIFRYDPLAPAQAIVETTPESKVAAGDPKKAAAIAKAVATQSKQPPDTSSRGVNKDDTAINPESLSEEEFDALPEAKKAQLRGDTF